MTAEIAIMNKSGIALAADSMMSSGTGAWPGVRKLFALSDHQPVAVMVYNNSCFMGDLWGENVIPAFKHHHGNRAYPTIAAWTNAFAEFVKGYGNFGPKDSATNLSHFVDGVLTEVEHAAAAATSKSGILKDCSKADAIDLTVDRFLHIGRGRTRVLSDTHVRQILTWGSRIVQDRCAEHGWPQCDVRLKRKVNKLIAARLGGPTPSLNHSGIVVAGYGVAQHAPAFCALEIEGHLGPYLKMRVADQKDMANEKSAQIAPFAQRDMVDTFITGMDDSLRDFIRDTAFVEFLDTLSELAAAEDDLGGHDLLCKTAADSLMAKITDHCTRAYTNKVMSLVEIMPPHELPGLAQALVRISVMRHRYSIDQPSVGDPIDVALMSRSRQTVDLRLNTRQEDNWRLAS